MNNHVIFLAIDDLPYVIDDRIHKEIEAKRPRSHGAQAVLQIHERGSVVSRIEPKDEHVVDVVLLPYIRAQTEQSSLT